VSSLAATRKLAVRETDPIVSLAPNRVLTVSPTKVCRVPDGTSLMALLSTCPIEAEEVERTATARSR
jgi:hypothetical protein